MIRPNGKAENRTEAEGDIDLDEDIQESGERFLHVF
jgi:cbb3-type cytochrome oxidase subunit 3